MNALRAFLWLRWRLAVNSLMGGRGRDVMAFLAGWATVLVRLILGLFFLGALVAVSVVAGVLAAALARPGGLGPDGALLGLRVLLGTLSLVVLLFPLVTRAGGELAYARRLRLLPVKQRHLDTLDIVGALADPWLAVLLPIPLVMSAVLWWNGRAGTALAALLAGLLMLVCLALAATVVRRTVALVLRDRRRAEAALLAMILGIMAVSFASIWLDPALRESPDGQPAEAAEPSPPPTPSSPAPAAPTGPGLSADSAAGGQARPGSDLRDVARTFPLALQLLPSELFAHALVGALEARAAVTLWCLLALTVLAVLLRLLARRLWRRTVGSPGVSGRSRGRRPLVWTRLPGLSPAAAAVAWVQATAALRTVAGKLALVMPTLVVLLMAVPVQLALASEQGAVADLFRGPQVALAGVGLAIIGLQTFACNQFAADGEGLARQLLLPLHGRDLLLGKTAGLGILVCVSTLLSVLAGAVVLRTGSFGTWLAALLAVLPIYLLLAPVTVVLSLYFPKAMDLSGLGSKSKPHQLATLIGLVVTGVVALPIMALVALGTGLLARPWLTVLALLLATALAALVVAIFVRFAADSVHRRREAILTAIREG